jgi:hypothetical protein
MTIGKKMLHVETHNITYRHNGDDAYENDM